LVLDPIIKGANLVIFILARATLLWAIVGLIIVRDRKKA
jgi:hypothetical protein